MIVYSSPDVYGIFCWATAKLKPVNYYKVAKTVKIRQIIPTRYSGVLCDSNFVIVTVLATTYMYMYVHRINPIKAHLD